MQLKGWQLLLIVIGLLIIAIGCWVGLGMFFIDYAKG